MAQLLRLEAGNVIVIAELTFEQWLKALTLRKQHNRGTSPLRIKKMKFLQPQVRQRLVLFCELPSAHVLACCARRNF